MNKYILIILLFICCIYNAKSQDTIIGKYQLAMIDTTVFQFYNYYRFYNKSKIIDVIVEKSRNSDTCLKELNIENIYNLNLIQTYGYKFLRRNEIDTSYIWLDINGVVDTEKNIYLGGSRRKVYKSENLFGTRITCDVVEEKHRKKIFHRKRETIEFTNSFKFSIWYIIFHPIRYCELNTRYNWLLPKNNPRWVPRKKKSKY